jgi:hypothetical protein
MSIQQPKQVYNRRNRYGLSTLIPRKRIMPTSRQSRRPLLRQTEPPADVAQLQRLNLPRLQNQPIPRLRIPRRALRIEPHLATCTASPARQVPNLNRLPGMLDGKIDALEPRLTRPAFSAMIRQHPISP